MPTGVGTNNALRELGGAGYLEPVTNWSDWRSDWMPTLEHFPVSKREGGKAAVDNAILAHRLCNRLDYSIRVGRSHARDLERIRKARGEAIRGNNVQIGNTANPEAEAATPKPKKTKMAPNAAAGWAFATTRVVLSPPPTSTGRPRRRELTTTNSATADSPRASAEHQR